jgi:hypothetical protein
VPTGGTDFLFSHVVADEGALGAPSAVITGSGIFAGVLAFITTTPAGIIILDQELGATFADAASVISGTITTTQANELCLCFAEHSGGTGPITMTGPAGITLVARSGSVAVYSFPKAVAGVTTAVTCTDAGGTSTKGWAVYLLSLMPPGN